MLIFTRRPGERFRIRFSDGTVYWIKLLAVEDGQIEVEVGRGDGAAQLDPLQCTKFWADSFSFDTLCAIKHNQDKLDFRVTLVDGSQVRLGFDGKAEVIREELLWEN